MFLHFINCLLDTFLLAHTFCRSPKFIPAVRRIRCFYKDIIEMPLHRDKEVALKKLNALAGLFLSVFHDRLCCILK